MNTEFALWPRIVKSESVFISYSMNDSLLQMRSVLFLNTIVPFWNTYFVAFHNLLISSAKKIICCVRTHLCTAFVTSSSLANLHSRKIFLWSKHVIIRWK